VSASFCLFLEPLIGSAKAAGRVVTNTNNLVSVPPSDSERLVDGDLGEVIEEASESPRCYSCNLVVVGSRGGRRMPYCVVTAAAAAVAGGAHAQEEEEVRIFYQPYGHGATKVLLIIGTARLAHSPPLSLFSASSPQLFLFLFRFLSQIRLS